ncbi:TetR/AcrR family transcriptional regulator [Rapidithrix thailandica]|uniref:TetR/AcrR family transcriptional regulator n=1 Tax=Rapidithrix thailandica TaxID=413964 RepID=A0AAW9S8Z6_9BACT
MRKGEATREVIIQKSAELFNKFGYDGCSLKDIMDATNLKKGGIYNHFNNKDEIALAAFDYSYKKVLSRFRQRLDKDRTARQKLNSIIEVFESFCYDPVISGGCPIFNSAIDSIDSHPVLRAKAVEAVNTLHQYIIIKLEEGKKSGEFKPEVKSEELATLFMSTLEGALIMSRACQQNKHMTFAVRFLRNYMENEIFS